MLKKPKSKMKLSRRGTLEDMKDQYTSVELQHKIQDWRETELCLHTHLCWIGRTKIHNVR